MGDSYSDWSKEGNEKYGKESTFHFIYGKDGKVASVIKVENNFRGNKTETNIFYDRERDKNHVFNKMTAAEMIEWEFTKRNDLRFRENK